MNSKAVRAGMVEPSESPAKRRAIVEYFMGGSLVFAVNENYNKARSRPMGYYPMLWVLGCNDVTRHDAVVSVRAGIARGELSSLWADHDHWQLAEHRAGIFSHLFIARHHIT